MQIVARIAAVEWMEGRRQMGELENGLCDLDGRDSVVLNRKYYRYDIPCAYHSPSHFVLIRHCENCTPREPTEIIVRLNSEQAHNIERALQEYTAKMDGGTDGDNKQ